MRKRKTGESISRKTRDYFDQGFNWAESISLSFKEYLGYPGDSIPGLATGFGGGIGRKGILCGALPGAVMVIGMISGRKDPKDKESREKTYEQCRQFTDRFEKEFGSSCCHTLIGCHLDNEEERQQWLAAGGMEKCASIVEKTAQMLFDFIRKIKWEEGIENG